MKELRALARSKRLLAPRAALPLVAVLLSLWCGWAMAGEVMPPAPTAYFNDYANVVAPPVAAQLNTKLEDFERQTSDQIVVVVYPKMQSDSSIEDYTVRVAQAWKVGQKLKNNGAVLFVFIQDRKMFLQVGYGLEGVLPDARAKDIIEDTIKPHFRDGDYTGGLSAGVAAILASVKGEYHGTGQTVAGRQEGNRSSVALIVLVLVVFLFVFLARLGRRGVRSRGWGYGSGGFYGGGWGGGWGGGGWGGGGGGGGGGFSGGGGSFGGGGAGGSW